MINLGDLGELSTTDVTLGGFMLVGAVLFSLALWQFFRDRDRDRQHETSMQAMRQDVEQKRAESQTQWAELVGQQVSLTAQAASAVKSLETTLSQLAATTGEQAETLKVVSENLMAIRGPVQRIDETTQHIQAQQTTDQRDVLAAIRRMETAQTDMTGALSTIEKRVMGQIVGMEDVLRVPLHEIRDEVQQLAQTVGEALVILHTLDKALRDEMVKTRPVPDLSESNELTYEGVDDE